MARIRYLKPDFFSDEDVAELSFPARLLFQGLWTLADREGRLEDRPAWIRVLIFPYDNEIAIGELLNELCKPRKHSPGAFIERYTVGEQRFIQIRNFAKHQKPHHKEASSVIPPPASPGKVGADPGKASASRPVNGEWGMGNGEGKGKEHSGELDPPRELLPDERAERDIRSLTVVLERKLLTAVGRLSERLGRDALGIMRQVTAYKKPDGTIVPGRSNPSGLTSERLEKSVTDAEGWLADLEREATA